jgi:signal transduction histidine kinase
LQESEGGKDEFADHMMGNIHQETLRARDIVKGLLEFSRQQDFSLCVYPLGQVVASAVRLVASQMPSNIVIRQDVAEPLILPLDRQRMQEALLNLLLNAKQAIEPGAGEIHIVARCEQEHVLLVVRDTGAGMDETTRQRIFDPFFSTKEVGQGTGLGLYIVYGIVEQHRGSIDVESAPGEGTVFSIRLPMAQKEEQ